MGFPVRLFDAGAGGNYADHTVHETEQFHIVGAGRSAARLPGRW